METRRLHGTKIREPAAAAHGSRHGDVRGSGPAGGRPLGSLRAGGRAPRRHRAAAVLPLLALLAPGCPAAEGGFGAGAGRRPEPQEAAAAPRVVRPDPDAPLGAPSASGRTGLQLQRAVDTLSAPFRVELRPGHYYLTPVPIRESRCGNCEDPETPVQATRGLLLTGRGVEVVGAAAESVVIHTNAGYGVLFRDCLGCALRGVTVTDGVRDPDGNATDAAVVVTRSSVRLERCRLRDNLGDSAVVAATVAGVMGVAGREGADLWIEGCRIVRNSWDGIALYRGARAVIRDNLVDGVDRAAGGAVGGGRGVGIGLTWDADAVVEGNLVRRYWKGIGIFVDARAAVRHNVVEDILTWGIAYWDAGRGRPTAFVEANAVYRTGACGASITRGDPGGRPPGAFVGNAFVRTGLDPRYDSGEPYCEQTALARHAVPANLLVAGNLFWNNREPGDRPGRNDLAEAEFFRRVRPLLELLSLRPPLRESDFLRELGAP